MALFFGAKSYSPKNILIVGAGKLAIETARYLKHFIPKLTTLDYHARNQRAETFEKSCQDLGVSARFIPTLDLSPYDTIIMVTNTNTCLVDNQNIEDVPKGAFLASLCTTSQVGEIALNVYAHDDFNVFFDYDLTRSFTYANC